MPLIGQWLRDRDAATWIEDQLQDLPQRLARARPASWLPTASEWTLHLLWTVVVAIALLIDGGRLVSCGLAAIPAAHRRQVERLVSAAHRALAGYAGGAALVATINAAAVFTIATVLGIGSAPILAVWAFVWNFVPQIGGFMGGVPLILFALASGPATALIASASFFAYQLIENHLIQPAVISAAIDVAPWATLLAALAGGAAAGAIGAVLFTPLVGVIRTAVAEMRRDDFPGATRPAPSALTDEDRPTTVAPLVGT
jgi:predicted PurR-regulated permease PerM